MEPVTPLPRGVKLNSDKSNFDGSQMSSFVGDKRNSSASPRVKAGNKARLKILPNAERGSGS
jgi:hypothetical protein